MVPTAMPNTHKQQSSCWKNIMNARADRNDNRDREIFSNAIDWLSEGIQRLKVCCRLTADIKPIALQQSTGKADIGMEPRLGLPWPAAPHPDPQPEPRPDLQQKTVKAKVDAELVEGWREVDDFACRGTLHL